MGSRVDLRKGTLYVLFIAFAKLCKSPTSFIVSTESSTACVAHMKVTTRGISHDLTHKIWGLL